MDISEYPGMATTIFPHQREVFDRLRATAQAYFLGDWQQLSIQPRWARLLVAPTGTGKSHLVRAVAAACQARFFQVSFGNWIPTGCSRAQGRQTVQSLVDALVGNERTVLLIDEIDKVAEETSWTAYLRSELYSILDGQFPAGTQFADEMELHARRREAAARRRLRVGCWIVGVGTWQSLWDRRTTGSIGFHESSAAAPLALDALSGTIPRETLNRFSSDLVIMSSMTAADYQAALVATARELPDELQDRFFARASKRITTAVQNGSGCRFLEEVLAELFVEDAATLGIPHDDIEPL
jgi:SpoVK/Ycf46/Vps4 family AAA+-type ATPase